MNLVTYHNKPELKAAFLSEIGKHEALDAIIKGSYGQMNGYFTGCAIGCSVYSLNILQGKVPKEAAAHPGDHARIEVDLGWPLWLAYAEDNIFERLPDALSKTWPRRLAEAMPVGVTVPDVVLAKMLRWDLIDDRFGVVHATDDEAVKAIVRTMGALFDRTIAGEIVSEAEWNGAAGAARAAGAAGAARAAGAAWAARAAGAGDAFYPALSDELLRLLRELASA